VERLIVVPNLDTRPEPLLSYPKLWILWVYIAAVARRSPNVNPVASCSCVDHVRAWTVRATMNNSAGDLVHIPSCWIRVLD
jgi:hypothetical protein